MAGGFRPITSIGDCSYNGRVQTYSVAATHATTLAVGDLVTETGLADANGIAGVDASIATGLISGVIVGISANLSNLDITYLPALTAGTVFVAPATEDLLLLATATTIALTDVSQNADITATAATVTGGLASSNMVINGAAYSAATAQIRIVSIVDGVIGANATVVCRINESTITGTVGV
jgi:uncharacterized protein YbjQ (UPF0145 family)